MSENNLQPENQPTSPRNIVVNNGVVINSGEVNLTVTEGVAVVNSVVTGQVIIRNSPQVVQNQPSHEPPFDE